MSRKPERVRNVSSSGYGGDSLAFWVNGRPASLPQYRRAWSILYPSGRRWPLPKNAGLRQRKRALDGRRALKGCEHEFEYREDWEGDPGVINGTHTLCWLECIHCGSERPASLDDAPCYDDWD